MKVTPKDLATLRAAIEPHDTAERRQAYRERRIARADAVQDIDMRYRWDLLWAAGGLKIIGGYERDDRPAYNSQHVDTALRSIVPALGEG